MKGLRACLFCTFLMAACGGPAFQAGEATPDVASMPDPLDGASTSTSPALSPSAEASLTETPSPHGGSTIDSPTVMTSLEDGAVDAESDGSLPTLLDAGEAADVRVDAPTVDAGPACPSPSGCTCESSEGECPAALPFSCFQGEECCSWRPPGC